VSKNVTNVSGGLGSGNAGKHEGIVVAIAQKSDPRRTHCDFEEQL
jgi:hypothetical protein